jgi:hypothetical protein
VLSGALPLAAVQMLLVIIAAISLAVSTHPIAVPLTVRAGMFVAAPFVLLAFNICVFTMLNATAVLFPGWIRLGPGGGGGIELMGQAMLMVLGVFLAVGILLIIPGIALALVSAVVAVPTVLNFAMALIVAALLLGLETYGLIVLLGRSFDRAEPTHVAE